MNRKQKKHQEKTAKRNTAHEDKEQAKYQALVTRLEEGKPLTPKQISFAGLHLTSITPDKRDEDDYECENCGVLWSAYEHFDTKGKTNWSQCEGCELGFATLATYLLTSGNAVIRRRKMEEMTTQLMQRTITEKSSFAE